MVQLSPKERALLHLLDSRGHLSKEKPFDSLTQAGIAEAMGVNRTHITRILKPLLNAGLVESNKGHVAGKGRKLTYYTLTESGLSRVKEVLRAVEDQDIEVIEGDQHIKTKVRDLLKERPELGLLAVADQAGGELRVELPKVRRIDTNAELEVQALYGRDEQMQTARRFIASDSKLLAVFANYGYGSSTFMKKVALELFDRPLFWHDLEIEGRPDQAMTRLMDFCTADGGSGEVQDLMQREVLICFDNYHDASEGMVDLLIELLVKLKHGRAKMMLALREDTPSYDRFYRREDLVSKLVDEVHMTRFDEPTSRLLIGEDIDDEAFQLIYMLTRGQPLALALTQKGDEHRLREIRLNEEVSFLMYLRTKRKTK